MFEEFKENPVRYIKSLAMDIIVALVGVAYIFYQMVRLEVTNLNPLTLIAGAFVGIVCGIVIKQALGENGFSKGYNSKEWYEEEQKYNEACNSAIEYIPLVDNFYLHLEKEKKEQYRRMVLQANRLRYQDWFDKYGNYIGKQEAFDKLDKKQQRVLKKAIKIKIQLLNLFSEYSASITSNKDKEITDNNQRRRNFSKNTISAVAIAIIGVYFIPVFSGWDWASFISSTMQVVLWVIFGVLQLYTNYNFVIKTKVATLKRKKEYIAKFVKGAAENKYDKPPYLSEDDMVMEGV